MVQGSEPAMKIGEERLENHVEELVVIACFEEILPT
jgi:hypothetical protein